MTFNIRNASRGASLILGCGAALSLLNCTVEATTDSGDLTELSIAAGESQVLRVPLAEDTPIVVTIDCGVPEGVDLMGNQIDVDASSMGAAEGPARAAYWQWAGVAPAGEHEVSVRNLSPKPANCKVSIAAQELPAEEPPSEDTSDGTTDTTTDEATNAACTAWTVNRSVIYEANHLYLGDIENGEWESLPASGNHWGTWAHWGKIYPKPVHRGYYLHNLEHGGAVFSYGCGSADESEACAAAEAALIELAETFGERRVIITPDPDQPQMFAVRTWRWAYSSECMQKDVGLDFLKSTFRHGREDIEGDPPLPYDPTSTEEVPCENLMAAPDSC